jgi:hypothetical protein
MVGYGVEVARAAAGPQAHSATSIPIVVQVLVSPVVPDDMLALRLARGIPRSWPKDGPAAVHPTIQ